MNHSRTILFSIIIIFVTTGVGSAITGFYEYNIDDQNTGRSPYTYNGNGSYSYYDIANTNWNSPLVDSDGNIYIGSFPLASSTGTYYSIYPNLTLRWTSASLTSASFNDVEHTDIIVGSNLILATATRMYVLNKTTGSEVCNATLSDTNSVLSSVKYSNGSVYIAQNTGGSDGYLYSYNTSCGLNWNYNLGNLNGYQGGTDSTPGFLSDGTIVIGTKNDSVLNLYENGTLKWKFTTGNNEFIDSGVLVDNEDNSYVQGYWTDISTNKTFHLWSINSSGGLRYSFETSITTGTEMSRFSPLLQTSSNSVIFGVSNANNFNLYSIEKDTGIQNYNVSIADASQYPHLGLIDNNGLLVFNTDWGGYYQVYVNNGTVKSWGWNSWGNTLPAIDSDGKIYNMGYVVGPSEILIVYNSTGGGGVTQYNSSGVTKTLLDVAIDGVNVTISNTTYSNSTLSDVNGSWNITLPVEGYYNITATKIGYSNHSYTNVYFVNSGGLTYNISMNPLGYLFSGYVTNRTSDTTYVELSNAVVVINNDTVSANTTTDATGYWNISTLSDGYYNVSITKSGYTSYIANNTQFSITGYTYYNQTISRTYRNVSGWSFENLSWVYDTSDRCCARSYPDIGNGEYSTMYRNVTITNSMSILQFYWMLNISNPNITNTPGDYIKFYIDNVEQVSIDQTCVLYGTCNNWVSVNSSPIESGNHTIMFKYRRNDLNSPYPHMYELHGGFVRDITIVNYTSAVIEDFESSFTWTSSNDSGAYWVRSPEDHNNRTYEGIEYTFDFVPINGTYSALKEQCRGIFNTGWMDCGSMTKSYTYFNSPYPTYMTFWGIAKNDFGGTYRLIGSIVGGNSAVVSGDWAKSGYIQLPSSNLITISFQGQLDGTGWGGVVTRLGLFGVDNITIYYPIQVTLLDDFKLYKAQGNVIDISGNYVANATVTFWNATANVSTTTNATGWYNLTNQTGEGYYNYSANKTGYGVSEGYVYITVDGCANVDITLYDVIIMGTVYDARTMLPISGASVNFYQYNYSDTGIGHWFTTVSNATGNYSLNGFELNKPINISASYPNYYHNDFNVTVTLPGTYILDLYLVPLCPGFVCGLTERLSFINSTFYWSNPTLGLVPISNATVTLWNATYSNSTVSLISGYYEIPIYADGNYSIYANKSKYVMRKTETVNVTNGTAVKFLLCICRGDINLDEYINVNDFVLFGTYYNTISTSLMYYWLGDLNDDNRINMDDFTLFAINYKQYCGVIS